MSAGWGLCRTASLSLAGHHGVGVPSDGEGGAGDRDGGCLLNARAELLRPYDAYHAGFEDSGAAT